jgi:hypothetical protein
MMEVRTEIEIAAPAARIWDALTDLARYREWNPLITQARGEARIGGVLDVRIRLPEWSSSRHRLRVLEVVPGRRFRWLGHMIMPGLLDGNHLLVLEPLAPERTRLCHSERFSGLLVPVVGRWLRMKMTLGFEAMNTALADRVGRTETLRTRDAFFGNPEVPQPSTGSRRRMKDDASYHVPSA